MRDMRHLRPRIELRLERRQLATLACGAVLGAGLLFAAGVLVGQRLGRDEVARLGPIDAGALALVPPPGSGDAASDELARKERERRNQAGSARRPDPRKTQPGPDQERPRKRQEFMVDAPLASAPEAAAVPLEALGPGRYSVQLASHQELAEARAHAGRLAEAGVTVRIVRAELAGKGTWYRLRSGDFPSELEANLHKAALARRGIDALVVRGE